jgi:guanylate kinase
MRGLIITGTSGVGKTHLEEELSKSGAFAQLVKYTDREARPGEKSSSTVSVTPEAFEQMRGNDQFLFTLEYAGKNYGWLRQEAQEKSADGKILTLGISLEALKDATEQLPDFIPVLLKISAENLPLLEKRIKVRENFQKLPASKKAEVEVKIAQRLAMARETLDQINLYSQIATEAGGLVFEIKDDTTLYQQVIPAIERLFGF